MEINPYQSPRVPQPGGHDALGVPRDRPLVVRIGVDHRQKRVF